MKRKIVMTFWMLGLVVLSGTAQNRIEKAGTPVAFSGFRVINALGEHDINLHGAITLGAASDGLKPGAERVVVVLGTQVAVLEPGSLRSSGDDGHSGYEEADQQWHYQDERAPLLRKLTLQKHGTLPWQFELGLAGSGAAGPSAREDLARRTVRDAASPPAAPRLFLRVGNDWGGVNLATGQPLLTFAPPLDMAHSSQASIGPAGGTLQITDATGAIITLKVPAGALRQTVNISMTALATSPEIIGTGPVTPGVQFEPEGLHFLIPATLTYDFHTTTTSLPTAPRFFLLTSPMTMVPLYGSIDLVNRTMTAMLFHFSNDQPATGDTAASDLTAWVNALLSASGGTLTVEEMASLLAAEDTQEQRGCTAACIDTGAVAQAIATAANATVATSCPADIANPSLPALQNYLQIDAFVQQVGASVPALRTCEHNVLGTLITQASTDPGAPLADLTDYISGNPTLRYLAKLLGLAQQLGFGDLETAALQKLDLILKTGETQLVTALKAQQPGANIAAVIQQEIAVLNQVQQVGDSNGVPAVDSGFDAFVFQQESSALAALINTLGSAAHGSPMKSNLDALVQAATSAQQLGFSNDYTLALHLLDAAVRALLSQGQQTCSTNTPTGKSLLQLAQSYVEVLGATDPGLSASIQQALGSCGSPLLRSSYSGTSQDTFVSSANPDSSFTLPPVPATLAVEGTPGTEATLDLQIQTNASFRDLLTLHVTISGSSLDGQITFWRSCGPVPPCFDFVPTPGTTQVILMVNSDGSISGKVAQSASASATRYFAVNLLPGD